MSTQTALILTEIGGRVTAITDWPIPIPGQGQVQIRVSVAGLNVHDQMARDEGFTLDDQLPAILANDLTGVVTALGPQTTKFKVGDRVFGHSRVPGNDQKGLQQYAVLDEVYAAKVPEGISEHDAAAVPTNVIAALVGLFDPIGLGIPAPWTTAAASFDYAATSLLIVGGGTNCGQFAVQLARMAGIGQIVTVGGNKSELSSRGVTRVVDRHAEDEHIVQQVREIVGDGLLYVLDTINLPPHQHLGISTLSGSRKGTIARLRYHIGQVDEAKVVGEKAAGYDIHTVPGVSQFAHETAKPFWDGVEEYLGKGLIVPPRYDVVKGWSADAVNAALDRYRDEGKVAKIQFEVST